MLKLLRRLMFYPWHTQWVLQPIPNLGLFGLLNLLEGIVHDCGGESTYKHGQGIQPVIM